MHSNSAIFYTDVWPAELLCSLNASTELCSYCPCTANLGHHRCMLCLILLQLLENALQNGTCVHHIHTQYATHLLRSDVTVADTTHYLETECMREAMEQVLYSNGVDVVLNGHLHEYERTNPVFVSHLLPCRLCTFSIAAEANFTSCHSRAAQIPCITACHACSRPAFAD